MKTEELNYIGDDPGAVKFGNFINYYTFHSAKERTRNLHEQMFPKEPSDPFICLDIGCNSGELTQEFYHYLQQKYPQKNIKILAVDIDANLIKRAKFDSENENLTYLALDIMTQDGQNIIQQYLNSHERENFDVTFCFSVTMWIHLNNGDEGLLNFLTFIKTISQTVIIETQPWSCYRNAQRRVKKKGQDFPLYHTLRIRSDVNLVIEQQMSNADHTKVYESQKSTWNRKIQSFKK